jgi:hypothetical protein
MIFKTVSQVNDHLPFILEFVTRKLFHAHSMHQTYSVPPSMVGIIRPHPPDVSIARIVPETFSHYIENMLHSDTPHETTPND